MLLITVILFSTIILWVYTIPTPSASGRVSFDGGLDGIYAAGEWDGAYINLTHLGGDDLPEGSTRIYLTIDNQTEVLRTKGKVWDIDNASYNYYGVDGSDATWNIGEMWSYRSNKTLIKKSATVSVMVVDLDRGLVLWNEGLLGAASSQAPIFLDKWTDSDTYTLTRDPVKPNDMFAIYAKVIDPDGDLNRSSVWANLTFRPNERLIQLMDDGSSGDRIPGDGIFSNSSLNYRAERDWDGGIILLNATDDEGHEARSRMTLSVVTFSDVIPSKFWQYVGAVQVNLEDVWFTQMDDLVNTDTTTRFSPYRTTFEEINGNGGNLFHIMMSNHGNRTVFLDGWTVMSFGKLDGGSRFSEYIVELLNRSLPGNDGGLGPYPGNDNYREDFKYVNLLDINPGDQEAGGTPQEILFSASQAFGNPKNPPNFQKTEAYFVTMLISGIMGPSHMTWEDIQEQWGSNYNPYDHLDDPEATKTYFYAQVVPFIGLVVY